MTFDPYPKNVGFELSKTPFTEAQIIKLKQNLPNNMIVRFYGLAGVGKGTTSKAVSEILEIPYVEGSFILRGATYIYEDLQLPLNEVNTDKVFEKISLRINEDNRLEIVYKGKGLKIGELKNSFIDMNVTKYSSDAYVRQKYYEKLGNFLANEIDSPCVLDSRGALPPYVLQAMDAGKPVVQILLKVDDQVAADRYYKFQMDKKLEVDPNYVETAEEKQAIYDQFHKDVTDRNKKDVVMMEKMGLGIVEPNSGIIDTSYMTVTEVIGTALSFVDSRVG